MLTLYNKQFIIEYARYEHKNFVSNSFEQNQNRCSFWSRFFFENRGVYEITWKHVVENDRPDITVRRMRIARSIPKTINTHLFI